MSSVLPGIVVAYGALGVAYLAVSRREAAPGRLAAATRGALTTLSLAVLLDLGWQLAVQGPPRVRLGLGLPAAASVFAWLVLAGAGSRWPLRLWTAVAAGALVVHSLGTPTFWVSVLPASLVGIASGEAIVHRRWPLFRIGSHWVSFIGAMAVLIPAALAERSGGASPVELGRALGGFVLASAGVALAAWGTVAFHRSGGTPEPLDPPGTLCRQGPYQYVRHPLQLAEMALVWAGVLLQWSPDGVLYALGFGAFLKGPLRWYEERRLEQRFAAEALDYRASVPAYLPGFKLTARAGATGTPRRLLPDPK